jgi:hypothetical protein
LSGVFVRFRAPLQGSAPLLVLVISRYSSTGILAAASLAHHSIMSSFLLRCQTIKPGIGRVRFCRRSWVEIIRLVLFVSVYMPLASEPFSGCEDLLSVHFTEPTYLCTVLHFLWAKICQWVTNYFLPSNDSAMVLIFSCLYLLFI